jgi:alkylation response protein AidB-like acyl-CoA dehydrogenase
MVFRKKLATRGDLGMSWPQEYGGAGKDMISQLILAEEMEYHHAPGIDGTITYIPPAIMAYGSEEQKRTFLPGIAAGELTFFLGYSEPEAGSDLASLRMRAVDDGDDFVLTGEKVFSSEAHHADYGWVAARTDPDAPKHRGISLFIVDMRSPGMSMGGFTTISGWHHPTVSFDHVRVPKSNLVGELHRGWYYIMGAIDFERASLGNPGLALRAFDRLVDHCKTTRRNGKPLIQDPLVRQRLAELYTEVEGVRLLSYWVTSMHANGLQPQHETSLSVLVKRETVCALEIFAAEILGPLIQLRQGDPLAPADGDFEHDYKHHLYFQFAAGGFDITRNVIAMRGLGLPRG